MVTAREAEEAADDAGCAHAGRKGQAPALSRNMGMREGRGVVEEGGEEAHGAGCPVPSVAGILC